ncbi:MAG: hypothetical protein P8Z80_20860 [Pseudolabrys sp.]
MQPPHAFLQFQYTGGFAACIALHHRLYCAAIRAICREGFMGLSILVVGLVVFFTSHFFVAARALPR